ncbi:MAG: nucleotidyltransferase family protein [bacterium]
MDLLAELRAQREDIVALAARHGVSNIRVFGSVARGEATATSDVDLLVDFDYSGSGLRFFALIPALEALLGRHVDLVTVNALNKYFRDLVLSEAVPL